MKIDALVSIYDIHFIIIYFIMYLSQNDIPYNSNSLFYKYNVIQTKKGLNCIRVFKISRLFINKCLFLVEIHLPVERIVIVLIVVRKCELYIYWHVYKLYKINFQTFLQNRALNYSMENLFSLLLSYLQYKDLLSM